MVARKKTDPPTTETAPKPRIGKMLFQRSRLGELLHNWQELIVWKPLLVLLLLVLFYALPRLDPRTGIDGFGDLFHLVSNVVVLATITFCTWLAKKTYLRAMDDTEEQDLWERARDGDRHALRMFVIDRLEWIALICLVLYALK